MLTLPLLATVARTVEWSPTVGLVMIIANILAFAIGKNTIQNPNVGPNQSSSSTFGGLSLGAFVGTLAFGHILGTGAILGLSAVGVL